MIKAITFKNYKAFDEGQIDFKPITILLGTNSSGKSSILQLLLMLEQTCEIESEYETALKLNGKYISLGEVENIFKNKELKKNIDFSVTCDTIYPYFLRPEISRISRNFENEISQLFSEFHRLDLMFNNKELKRNIYVTHSEPQEESIYGMFKLIKKIKSNIGGQIKTNPKLLEELIESELFLKYKSRNKKDINNLIETEIKDYEQGYKLLKPLMELRFREYILNWSLRYSSKEKN